MAEIAVLFVETDLANDADAISVQHNIKIPQINGGKRRQFDVVVRSVVNEHEFIRVIEVQRRAQPVGQSQMDSWLQKAKAVGAHRLTTVCKSYNSAIQREVEANRGFLQAYELQPANDDDWPGRGRPPALQFELAAGRFIQSATQAFVYRALGQSPARYVALCSERIDGHELLVAVIASVSEGNIRLSSHLVAGRALVERFDRLELRGVDEQGNEVLHEIPAVGGSATSFEKLVSP